MKEFYSILKWRYWRQSYLYYWILCKHMNAIVRYDYGSRWKNERHTVYKLYGGWSIDRVTNLKGDKKL